MRKTSWLTLAAIGCCAGSALGQSTNMYLFRDIDLFTNYGASAPSTAGNPVYIGNNPSAIALGNNALFVSGWNNSGVDQDLGAIKISGLYTTLGLTATSFDRFTTFPGIPGGRGTVGMAYYRRNTGSGFESRLIVGWDDGSGGTGAFKLFDAETASPTLITAGMPVLNRWSAGPAWDFGPNGLGYVYGTNPNPRPVAASLRFGDKIVTGILDDMSPIPDFGAVFTYPSDVRILPDGVANTEWRRIDIDPRDGTVLAAANDSVVVALRTIDGSFNGKYGALSAGSPGPLPPSGVGCASCPEQVGPRRIYGPRYPQSGIIGRSVRLLHGWADAGVGDLVVWNSRPNTTTLNTAFRANRYSDGTPVTVNFLTASGTTPTFPSSVGILDFGWDSALGVLAVMDFQARRVYLFSNTQPGSCALPSNAGCVILPANVCASVGGVAGAAGSTCPTGSCCGTSVGVNAGVCTVVTQAECFSTSTFWTAGAVCTPTNPCPQPGSCCTIAGACTVTLSTQCTGGSGFVLGGVCTPTPACPPTGSCCITSTCTITYQAGCTGTWTSGGACTPTTCATASGVCCRGTTCSTTVTQANCSISGAQAGAAFVSSASTCNTNFTTPCCFADYDKVGGIATADIFAYLNDWFASSTFADVGGNGTVTPDTTDIFDFLNAWFAGGC
ncbi:MAG: hypothetical protein K2W85_12085 [Phycisphaerales bacterium]|nr:hypothetical protein [Phycisphaerales bacterium]